VILTGAGREAFVAGADISELASQTPLAGKARSLAGQAVFRRFEAMRKPVTAAINGFCLGGGCELAMACHIRIASETAKFGQPEVKLGIGPGYGATVRLPRLVGRGRATQLLLTGEMIDARGVAHRAGRGSPRQHPPRGGRGMLRTILDGSPRGRRGARAVDARYEIPT
jgi:enoyl-CoA hydratase